jgi:hypothetical protein
MNAGGKPNKRGAPMRRGGRGWLATLAAVLIAFSFQSLVTQTHQHFDFSAAFASTPAKADAAGQPAGKRSPSELPANCPICREIAQAGHAVLTAPVEFKAPAPAVAWFAATKPLGGTISRPSHAWRSRAPPQKLQA